VLSGDGVIAELPAEDAETLIAEGTAQGGMAPKLRAAARAATAAGAVRIGGLEMMTQAQAGTRVFAAAAPETRG
jgi:acetylglutamate kinase